MLGAVRQPATWAPERRVLAQRKRLIDLYADVHIGREEFVGRMRALEASLTGGLPQPSYFEADLVKVKGLLHDWKVLWSKATPEERQDIVAALFREVRVRDKNIVSATLADAQYAPLIASSEARRLRLLTPADDEEEQVGLAPPDGSRGARPIFVIEGVSELVMELLAV